MTDTNISIPPLVFQSRIEYAGSMSKMPPPSNYPIKVFIADDSLIVRERLIMLFDELSGVEMVGQAETVAESISAIGKLQPDVVILDIRMPGGSGIDVLQNIKRDGVGPMVIILTNYPFPGYRQKCMQAGADFFLDKSVEFDQIPALVERLRQGSEFDEASRIKQTTT